MELGKCFNCGGEDHYARSCPELVRAQPETVRPRTCLRCGLPHFGQCQHMPASPESVKAWADSIRRALGWPVT